jgi:hypothetical protein
MNVWYFLDFEFNHVAEMPKGDPLPNTADVTYIGQILWQRRNEKLPDWVTALSYEQPVVWVYPGKERYKGWN